MASAERPRQPSAPWVDEEARTFINIWGEVEGESYRNEAQFKWLSGEVAMEEGPSSTSASHSTSGTDSPLKRKTPAAGCPGTAGAGRGERKTAPAQQPQRGPVSNAERLRMLRLRKKNQRETMADRLLDISSQNVSMIARTIQEIYERDREHGAKEAKRQEGLVRMMVGRQEKTTQELVARHRESLARIRTLIHKSRTDFREAVGNQTAALESLVRALRPDCQPPFPAVCSPASYQLPFPAPGPSQGFGQGGLYFSTPCAAQQQL